MPELLADQSATQAQPNEQQVGSCVLTDEKGHSIKIRIASPPPQRQLRLQAGADEDRSEANGVRETKLQPASVQQSVEQEASWANSRRSSSRQSMKSPEVKRSRLGSQQQQPQAGGRKLEESQHEGLAERAVDLLADFAASPVQQPQQQPQPPLHQQQQPYQLKQQPTQRAAGQAQRQRRLSQVEWAPGRVYVRMVRPTSGGTRASEPARQYRPPSSGAA